MIHRRFAAVAVLCSCLGACNDEITEGDGDRTTIGLSSVADTLNVLTSRQLNAAVMRDGAALPNADVTWSSSDTLVATVSSTGLVRARGMGATAITARFDAADAVATIVVDSVRQVLVTPESRAIYVGDSVRLNAIGVGVLRTAVLASDVSWVSDDPRIATVSATGMVLARGPGVTRISAGQHGAFGTTVFAALPTNANRPAACAGRGTIHRGSVGTMTWRAVDSPHFLLEAVLVNRLTIEPGATVCGLPGSSLTFRGDALGEEGLATFLEARGTADRSIHFTAVDTLQGWQGIDGRIGHFSATLAHAILEHATDGLSGWNGLLTIHDSRFRNSHVEYCGVLTRVDIRGSLFEAKGVCISDGIFENNALLGSGLQVFQDRAARGIALISGCSVTDSPYDGIRILNGATAEIHGCNLERNAGFGINNLGTSHVDARRNWWGDPAGPSGPSGDGVSGTVDTSGHLSSPSTR